MIHNHPILSLLVLTLAMTFLMSCTTAPQDTTAEDLQAINAVNKKFTDNFNSGNIDALSVRHSEEPKILPPNSPVIVDKDGIQAVYQGFYDAGARDLQFTVIDFNANGDMAHSVGKFTFTIQPEEGEAINESGKYVELWKRENGSWKLDVLIWNTSVPLPAPEAPPTAEEEE